MGPYCNFCNNRCFVHMPEATPQEALDAYGINTIIATCQGGQAFEMKKIGWNYGKIMTVIGQDCPFCPKGDNGYHQYQIEAGCFVEGKPSCRWCAMTEEISEAYMSGESSPLGPAEIGKLEEAVWARYCAEEGKPAEQEQELCEGCHRAEEMCICGGVPDEFAKGLEFILDGQEPF